MCVIFSSLVGVRMGLAAKKIGRALLMTSVLIGVSGCLSNPSWQDSMFQTSSDPGSDLQRQVNILKSKSVRDKRLGKRIEKAEANLEVYQRIAVVKADLQELKTALNDVKAAKTKKDLAAASTRMNVSYEKLFGVRSDAKLSFNPTNQPLAAQSAISEYLLGYTTDAGQQIGGSMGGMMETIVVTTFDPTVAVTTEPDGSFQARSESNPNAATKSIQKDVLKLQRIIIALSDEINVAIPTVLASDHNDTFDDIKIDLVVEDSLTLITDVIGDLDEAQDSALTEVTKQASYVSETVSDQEQMEKSSENSNTSDSSGGADTGTNDAGDAGGGDAGDAGGGDVGGGAGGPDPDPDPGAF